MLVLLTFKLLNAMLLLLKYSELQQSCSCMTSHAKKGLSGAYWAQP